MQPTDPRDPNAAAPAGWPGEQWTGQHANENPTLPRMAPIPPPQGAPAGPSAPQTNDGIPPLPRFAPPPSGPMHAAPLSPAMQVAQQSPQGYPTLARPRARGANASPVDFAAVPTGAWLAGGGGLAMLLGSFLPWLTLSVTGANNRVTSHSQSGWDLSAFGRVTALIGLLALALFVVRLLNVRVPVRLPWTDRNIYLALGIEALLLGILYLIDDAHAAQSVRGLSVGPAFGLFLTVLGAIALTVGAYLLGRPDPRAR
jgi:hypothetical protein